MEHFSFRRWVGPVGAAFAVGVTSYHLWEHWPIRDGHVLVVERLRRRFEGVPMWLEAALFVVPLLVYLGGSLWALGRPGTGLSGVMRRNQRVAGAVWGLFMLWHLGTVWWPSRVGGQGPLHALYVLEEQLQVLWGAGLYVLGLSALCVHVGYDLGSAGQGFGGDRPGAPPWASLLAFGLAVGLWFVGIDILAAYVAGAPVL